MLRRRMYIKRLIPTSQANRTIQIGHLNSPLLLLQTFWITFDSVPLKNRETSHLTINTETETLEMISAFHNPQAHLLIKCCGVKCGVLLFNLNSNISFVTMSTH